MLNEQLVSLPIQITASSMSALSTTSDLPLHGIVSSIATVGDSYDNAPAENVNDIYKNKLIHTRRWDHVVEVEVVTFEWCLRWNEARLHQSLGYRTSAEVETEFWNQDLPQGK